MTLYTPDEANLAKTAKANGYDQTRFETEILPKFRAGEIDAEGNIQDKPTPKTGISKILEDIGNNPIVKAGAEIGRQAVGFGEGAVGAFAKLPGNVAGALGQVGGAITSGFGLAPNVVSKSLQQSGEEMKSALNSPFEAFVGQNKKAGAETGRVGEFLGEMYGTGKLIGNFGDTSMSQNAKYLAGNNPIFGKLAEKIPALGKYISKADNVAPGLQSFGKTVLSKTADWTKAGAAYDIIGQGKIGLGTVISGGLGAVAGLRQGISQAYWASKGLDKTIIPTILDKNGIKDVADNMRKFGYKIPADKEGEVIANWVVDKIKPGTPTEISGHMGARAEQAIQAKQTLLSQIDDAAGTAFKSREADEVLKNLQKSLTGGSTASVAYGDTMNALRDLFFKKVKGGFVPKGNYTALEIDAIKHIGQTGQISGESLKNLAEKIGQNIDDFGIKVPNFNIYTTTGAVKAGFDAQAGNQLNGKMKKFLEGLVETYLPESKGDLSRLNEEISMSVTLQKAINESVGKSARGLLQRLGGLNPKQVLMGLGGFATGGYVLGNMIHKKYDLGYGTSFVLGTLITAGGAKMADRILNNPENLIKMGQQLHGKIGTPGEDILAKYLDGVVQMKDLPPSLLRNLGEIFSKSNIRTMLQSGVQKGVKTFNQ